MQRFLFTCLVLLCTGLFSSMSSAAMLKLYDQPNNDAKVVGSLDSSGGIIPIFTPKNSDWIKVANPKNGDVGWVKQSDLKAATGVTFTQSIINSGNNKSNSFEVIQVGNNPSLTKEQMQDFFKRMEVNHEAIQKSMQNVMGTLSQEFKNMPMVMPVVFVPVQKQDATPSTSTTTTTKTK